jgi:DNA-binding MarR family transcriptional regulator
MSAGSDISFPMSIGTPRRATPATIEAVAAVRLLARRADASIDGALEEMGLTAAQFFFLRAVDRAPREHIAEHARSMRTSRQAADRLARRLVRSGLIDLMPKDLGVRGLVLSDVGRRRLRLAVDAVAAVLAGVDDAVDQEGRTRLAALAEQASSGVRPRPRPWWFD